MNCDPKWYELEFIDHETAIGPFDGNQRSPLSRQIKPLQSNLARRYCKHCSCECTCIFVYKLIFAKVLLGTACLCQLYPCSLFLAYLTHSCIVCINQQLAVLKAPCRAKMCTKKDITVKLANK